MVAVDATLQVLNGTTLEPVEVAVDATSPTGRALPTVDAAARSTLVDILSASSEDTQPAKAVTVAAAGVNTVHDPAPAKKIRLYYVALNADGANTADVTAAVRFAGDATDRYKLSLKAGAIWARNVGAGKRYIEGVVDQLLVVDLSVAQTVHVSIEYDEI